MPWTLIFVFLTPWVLKPSHMFQSFAVWFLVLGSLRIQPHLRGNSVKSQSQFVTLLFILKIRPHILATLTSNFYVLGSVELPKVLLTFLPFSSSPSIWLSVSHSQPRIRKYLKRIKHLNSTENISYFCSYLLKIFVILQFSHTVVSNCLGSQGLQHARLPRPLPTPRIY